MIASRVTRARTLASELSGALARAYAEERAAAYPLTKYQRSPVQYVRERLGEQHVMPHQIEMLEALARGVAGEAPDRVACRSGQKSGKTKTAIWAALWHYECFDAARTFLCAAIIEQTKNVLWRELEQTIRDAKARGVEIDGRLAASPAGGLVSLDGSREIRGVSGREIEAVAGLSGRMLTIIDEASHLPETKAQAFMGNTMGGGSLFLISNPTRNSGPFYEAFHEQKDHWQTFHVDSEKVAQWQRDTGIRIPFTATIDKIEEFREIYGEDSPFWFLRVKGEWLVNETGRAIPMVVIIEAVARWATTPEDGPLRVGYDCAGPGQDGDEHAWAVVRGDKCLAIIRRRGLMVDAALAQTFSILSTYAKEGEIPTLLVDEEGPIGGRIFGRFLAEAEHRRSTNAGQIFEVRGVKASSKHVRDPSKFERVRDELIWVLGEWLQFGSIPNDGKLQAELYAIQWSSLPDSRLKATSKADLWDILRRSPDSLDALALAIYQPVVWRPEQVAPPAIRYADPMGGDSAWAFEGASSDDAHDSPFWPTGGDS